MIVAGIGCRRGCQAADIVALVRQAGCRAGWPDRLAAPWFKGTEPGLHEAAEALGLPLMLVDEQALSAVQARCVTVSAAAFRASGHGSIAEGAALAAAGAGAHLVLPRIAAPRVTCALAASP